LAERGTWVLKSWSKCRVCGPSQPTAPTDPTTPKQGKVTGVEDFGAIVEWTAADGSKQSGLLHISEMRAPAAAAAAELGDDAEEAEEGEAGGLMADEGEFAGEAYWDVGGIDKASRYYKVRRGPGGWGAWGVQRAGRGLVRLSQRLIRDLFCLTPPATLKPSPTPTLNPPSQPQGRRRHRLLRPLRRGRQDLPDPGPGLPRARRRAGRGGRGHGR